MADDKKRLDLSQDLDGILGDIAAATNEVKQRKEADRVKEAKSVQKTKSRRVQLIIIAAAVVVIIIVAYFTVFSSKPPDISTKGTTGPISHTAPRSPLRFPSTQPTYANPGHARPVMPFRHGNRTGTQVSPNRNARQDQPDDQPAM